MLAEKLNKVNAHDPSRQTAFMWAAEGHVDVGLVLIELGTDVRARSKQNSPRCSTRGAR